jgi:hypothetical protein
VRGGVGSPSFDVAWHGGQPGHREWFVSPKRDSQVSGQLMPKGPLPVPVDPPDCPYSTVCSSRFPSWFCSRPTTAEMSDSVCDTAGVPVLQPYLQQQQRDASDEPQRGGGIKVGSSSGF